MKIIGGATRAEFVPVDRETGKIIGNPIPIKSATTRRKPLSYGKVKYKVEWVK